MADGAPDVASPVNPFVGGEDAADLSKTFAKSVCLNLAKAAEGADEVENMDVVGTEVSALFAVLGVPNAF